jgi:hypothetical protein
MGDTPNKLDENNMNRSSNLLSTISTLPRLSKLSKLSKVSQDIHYPKQVSKRENNQLKIYQVIKLISISTITSLFLLSHNSPTIAQTPQTPENPIDESVNKTSETSIPPSIWQGFLNGLFSQTQVRLNNYTKKKINGRHFLANDSSIGLRNLKYPFNIPEQKRDRYRYYVNDIKSSSIKASNEGELLKITILMENQGREFLGDCIDNFFCGLFPAPEVEMNNTEIDIYLKPVVVNGALTYKDVRVKFHGNIQAQGICNGLFSFVCYLAAGDYRGSIKNSVEEEVQKTFETEQYKTLISDAINIAVCSFPGACNGLKSVYFDVQGNLILQKISSL